MGRFAERVSLVQSDENVEGVDARQAEAHARGDVALGVSDINHTDTEMTRSAKKLFEGQPFSAIGSNGKMLTR